MKGFIYQGIETLRKTVEERPELIRRTIKANEMAYCWVKDPKNFDELISILKQKLPAAALSDAQFRDMVKQNIPTFTLTFPTEQVKKWSEVLVGAKMLKQPLQPEQILWKDTPTEEPKCG